VYDLLWYTLPNLMTTEVELLNKHSQILS